MTQANPVDQTTGNRLVLEDNIEVPAPVSQVYQRWTDFRHFPDFMKNVQEVQPLGGNRYHWAARMFGIKQQWDAEVTDQLPNSRVSWRSTTGPFNQGTVSFSPLGPNSTEVRLRLEYAPPAGKVGQTLDQLTQTTHREIAEDLKNFKKLFTGGLMSQAMFGELAEQQSGAGTLLARFAVPAAVGLAGGYLGYRLERQARRRRIRGAKRLMNRQAATTGWLLTAGSLASIGTSAILRSRGDRSNALFIGQWAPTLLQAGILSRAIGHRGIRTPLNTAGTSWGFAAACLGAIATSAVLHARGRRGDGLFVGLWAPTFLGAALLARLLDR